MSDNILQLIYTFSKKFIDPKTKLPLNLKIIIFLQFLKMGLNIFLQASSENTNQYKKILRKLLKQNIEQISGINSVNIALTSNKDEGNLKKNLKLILKI